MNVSSIALYPVNPVIPYLIINNIFYDFMDVTNVAYFNQEGHFYNPSEFNTVAYVLKYHETVVDVIGEPHSQNQLFPQGGHLFVDKVYHVAHPFLISRMSGLYTRKVLINM